MKKRVKLLRHWRGFPPNTHVDVEATIADLIIAAGTATGVAPADTAAPGRRGTKRGAPSVPADDFLKATEARS